MVNHYPDPDMDDCPIHDDLDTQQFYRVEMIIPIGIDVPHAGWKSAANWVEKFIFKINKNKSINSDMKKHIKYRFSLGHKGIIDNKTCYKYFEDNE